MSSRLPRDEALEKEDRIDEMKKKKKAAVISYNWTNSGRFGQFLGWVVSALVGELFRPWVILVQFQLG